VSVPVTHPRGPAAAPRKGARRPSEVPDYVLEELAAGGVSRNHMEQMALDQGRLLETVLPSHARRADELRGLNFLGRLRAGAVVAWDALGEDLFDVAGTWPSDTARGWAAFAVPLASGDTGH